jgi:hypothetical protein
VPLEWVGPAVIEARTLWLLRVGDSGRCVVGNWTTAQAGFQVVRHAFWNEGNLEIVLLGLGPPPRHGWMVLITDGKSLWSGLDSTSGRPGALMAEQVEFRQEADRLRLAVLDGAERPFWTSTAVTSAAVREAQTVRARDPVDRGSPP